MSRMEIATAAGEKWKYMRSDDQTMHARFIGPPRSGQCSCHLLEHGRASWKELDRHPHAFSRYGGNTAVRVSCLLMGPPSLWARLVFLPMFSQWLAGLLRTGKLALGIFVLSSHVPVASFHFGRGVAEGKKACRPGVRTRVSRALPICTKKGFRFLCTKQCTNKIMLQ